jgi:hypothetical protein
VRCADAPWTVWARLTLAQDPKVCRRTTPHRRRSSRQAATPSACLQIVLAEYTSLRNEIEKTQDMQAQFGARSMGAGKHSSPEAVTDLTAQNTTARREAVEAPDRRSQQGGVRNPGQGYRQPVARGKLSVMGDPGCRVTAATHSRWPARWGRGDGARTLRPAIDVSATR